MVAECEALVAQLLSASSPLMTGDEEKRGEGGLGEPLPPPHEPPQQLSQGIAEELPQHRPQLSLPHHEDKQEGDEEEDSQHREVQLSAPQLFGEGCACEGRGLFPLIAKWGKEVGSLWDTRWSFLLCSKRGKAGLVCWSG